MMDDLVWLSPTLQQLFGLFGGRSQRFFSRHRFEVNLLIS
jgi:hypothetical protein